MNDFFTAYGNNENYEIKSIKIYNQKGNLIFEKKNLFLNDEEKGWNGRNVKTNLVQNGVYVFSVSIQMENQLKVLKET